MEPNLLDVEIGKLARHWRMVRKMSLSKLGAQLKEPLSHQQISKYEYGRQRWSVSLLLDVRRILDVSFYELLPAAVFNEGLQEEPKDIEGERLKQQYMRMPENQKRAVLAFFDCL